MRLTPRPVLHRLAAAASASLLAATGLVAAAMPASAATATDLLSQLTVAPETIRPTYVRELFDYGNDGDGDNCDTRHEVLIQEASGASISASCAVRGTWTSYYDGVTTTNAADLEVDHLVPLAEAWYSGASAWTSAQQRAFGNDLAFGPSLVAVTAALNQSKGDKDFAEWSPPLASAKCRYATEWVQIKYRWSLSVDQAERDALATTLSACGSAAVEVPAKAIGANSSSGGGGGSSSGGSSSTIGSQLSPGQSMAGGQWLMAPNGRYGLAFQADGNLVAYGPNYRPLWHAGTYGNPGATFTLQGDGNAVIYAADGRVLWHSYTYGFGGSTLRVQNDGNVVIYRPNGAAAWYSGWDTGQRAGGGSRGVNLLGRVLAITS